MSWETDSADLAAAVKGAFGVSITVIEVTLGSYNTATGEKAKTVSEVAVTAVRGRTSTDYFGEGKTGVEGVTYDILAADLAAITLNTRTQVQDGARTFSVAAVERLVDEKMVRLVCLRTR